MKKKRSEMEPVSFDLTGCVAVVTGGAGGIGSAIVRRLAEVGTDVLVGYGGDRRRAEQLVAELPRGGHAAVALPVTDSSALSAFAGRLLGSRGKLDILVNCAAVSRLVPHNDLDGLDDNLIDRIFAVNVRGLFSTVRAFAPALKASRAGVVVNLSSTSATSGIGSNIAYCASKAAVETMSLSLSRVLAPDVRVLCVAPDLVRTGFVPERDPADFEKAARESPLRRLVEPDDVALAVLACVTHLGASTGTRITVDAGRNIA